ncbi:MAG: DUF6046 domain-containing protein [Paludibacter sp.]|nr:DUF6046 domain-containing protein [Paludibacter sp.]
MSGYNFNEFDLGKIFKSVWGYTAAPFLFTKKKSRSDYSFGDDIVRRENNIKGSPFYSTNNNGNEVFLPIWLIRTNGDKFLLQNTVSSFTSKKNIVETTLINQQGSVKEEISIDDWEVNVKGIIVSDDYDYPDQQVADLRQLYKLSESLEIENARSSLLFENNERVVIRDLKFTEIKGMKNMQAFEMNLVSDFEFKLIY